MRAVTLVVCALLLGACGGGGGGQSPAPAPTMSLAPKTVTETFIAGSSNSLAVVATASAPLSAGLSVKITDQADVLQPTATLTAGGGDTYSIGLSTSPSLAPGHYTGNFQLSICYDPACAQTVSGSPASVAFDFTVLAAYTLSPSTLSSTFTAGSPNALTMTVTPAEPSSAPAQVSLADPDHVLSAARSVTANNNGSYTITVEPLSSLKPGHLTGSLSLSLCQDVACATPFTGSLVSVPYDFTILAAPPSLTLSPATANGSFTAGDPVPFLIKLSATLADDVSFPIYVSVSDSSGTFLATASLSSEPSSHYTLTVQAKPSLAAGHYTGSAQLNVCNDQGCTEPLLGSPVTVPFDIQIVANANAGLTTLTPWAGVGDWETFQGNAAHTGFVPVTLDPTVFASRWLWTAPNKDISTVTTAAGRLYVNSGHITYALSESDHSIVWQHDFSVDLAGIKFTTYVNPPAVSGGSVFVTTSPQQGTWMFGFRASDGTLLFKTAFDSQGERYLAPTVDSGEVFEDGGYYGGMYAFDGTAGTQTFYTTLPQYDEWTPAIDANYAYAYTGGVSSTVGQLSVVDRHTGALIASITDPSFKWDGYDMHAAPVLGQPGSVFAVNVGDPDANSLLDFDTNAQTITWQVAGEYGGNPAYGAAVLYAINVSPYRLEARSETDGSLLWSWSPLAGRSETKFIGDVLATNNLVFVSTNTTTYAISQSTHLPVWSIPMSGRLSLSANGVLYVVAVDVAGNTNGTVLAVNVKN